ncbi:MAG TPA: hypothetical protein VEI46_10335, partial [Thermodesulfovibrionales bacterium]|nr:hypothetical protein [Thermodesulfovibrionales bacterium]
MHEDCLCERGFALPVIWENMMAFLKGIDTMPLMMGLLVTSMAILFPLPCLSDEFPQVFTSLSVDMGNKVVGGKSSIIFSHSGEQRIHVGSLKIKSVRYK